MSFVFAATLTHEAITVNNWTRSSSSRNIIVIFIIFVIIVKVFKNMDKDGSGTVSKDEFLKICKNLSKEQVSGTML